MIVGTVYDTGYTGLWTVEADDHTIDSSEEDRAKQTQERKTKPPSAKPDGPHTQLILYVSLASSWEAPKSWLHPICTCGM